MRVLIISAFDPLPGDGSLLIRYPYIAEAIASRGCDVDYVSSSFFHGKKQFREDCFSPNYRIHLLPAIPYSNNIGLGRLRHHRHFAKQLGHYLEKADSYDLIISAFPPIEANEVVCTYAKKAGTPYIIDIQDAWPHAFWKKLGGKYIGRMLTAPLLHKVKRILEDSSAVFCVSKDYLTLLGVSGKSFPLGISTVAFPSTTVPMHFEKPEGDRVVLFMGSSGQTSFVKALIECWRDAPKDTHLVLAGAADWMNRIKSDPEKKLWCFPGLVPSQELLQQCDIGLATPDPATYSRLPFKVFGYLSEGLSLMTNIQDGELSEWIEAYGLGATFDNTVDDFFAKLKRLNPTPESQSAIRSWAFSNLQKENIYDQYAGEALKLAGKAS